MGNKMAVQNKILPVVLCGGVGTRLWPLSRKSFPKQFVPLFNGKSLFQLTLERLGSMGDRVTTIAAEEHRFIVLDLMVRAGVKGDIGLEPEPRNTAAAMALAALTIDDQQDDGLLLFCPSDHHIPDADLFAESVGQGIEAAESGAIVTFGVTPAFPSRAFGYLEKGERLVSGGYQVDRFIEKPDEATAQRLLLTGNVLWNTGIFLCSRQTLITALKIHAPEILEAVRKSVAGQKNESFQPGLKFYRPDPAAFAMAPAISVDYAVMEHYENVAVVPFKGQWNDVGSWSAIAALTTADDDGNRIEGDGIAIEAANTFIHAPHRPVVALGTSDLLIIDTPDALLVTTKNSAEKVRDVVDHLERANYSQAITHRKIFRPWGWYERVDFSDRFQVKRIGVKPGAALSLQKHHQRAEHWIIVTGVAEVTCGDEVFLLSENQSTYIPIGEIHRLKNLGETELEMIEVQSGEYLGEDDIIRLEDRYGRAPQDC